MDLIPHDIALDPHEQAAAGVAAALHRAGFAALFAGGWVRDRLMGHAPGDIDIATSATPNEVAAIFPKTLMVGEAFGVCRVRVRRPEAAPGAPYVADDDSRWWWFEVATFRADGPYSDGRRPDSVTLLDGAPGAGWEDAARADAQRRDFTVNGLFWDPAAGQILDFVGGRHDLNRRALRAIGDPAARFAEDHLRLMRLPRLAAQLDFAIDPGTANAASAAAPAIRRVAIERIHDELRKILITRFAAVGLKLLESLGLSSHIGSPSLADAGLMSPAAIHAVSRLPWPRTLEIALAAWMARTPGALALLGPLGFSNAVSAATRRIVSRLDDVAAVLTAHPRRARALADLSDFDAIAIVASVTGHAAGADPAQAVRSRAGSAPSMPAWLDGSTLIAEGVAPGRGLGTLLKQARENWLDGKLDDLTGLRAWLSSEGKRGIGW